MKIIKLTEAHIPQVVSMFCDSFANDGLYRYFIPEESKRKAFLKDFFRFRVRFGLHHGVAYVTEDFGAAAIWIPPTVKMEFSHLIKYGGFVAILKKGFAVMKRVVGFNNDADAILAQYAPSAYWLLSPIATAPSHQGKGYAKALLTHQLNEIDKLGQPCMLETQSQANVAIYEKFGFVTVHQSQLEGTDFPHTLMMRQPQPFTAKEEVPSEK